MVEPPSPKQEYEDTTGSDSSSFQKITGSVGGRWDRPADVGETHKPVVSTWGVFERPKDISKAFGGGRDPTLRRIDPAEQERRDEETQSILRRSVAVSEAIGREHTRVPDLDIAIGILRTDESLCRILAKSVVATAIADACAVCTAAALGSPHR